MAKQKLTARQIELSDAEKRAALESADGLRYVMEGFDGTGIVCVTSEGFRAWSHLGLLVSAWLGGKQIAAI